MPSKHFEAAGPRTLVQSFAAVTVIVALHAPVLSDPRAGAPGQHLGAAQLQPLRPRPHRTPPPTQPRQVGGAARQRGRGRQAGQGSRAACPWAPEVARHAASVHHWGRHPGAQPSAAAVRCGLFHTATLTQGLRSFCCVSVHCLFGFACAASALCCADVRCVNAVIACITFCRIARLCCVLQAVGQTWKRPTRRYPLCPT